MVAKGYRSKKLSFHDTVNVAKSVDNTVILKIFFILLIIISVIKKLNLSRMTKFSVRDIFLIHANRPVSKFECQQLQGRQFLSFW